MSPTALSVKDKSVDIYVTQQRRWLVPYHGSQTSGHRQIAGGLVLRGRPALALLGLP